MSHKIPEEKKDAHEENDDMDKVSKAIEQAFEYLYYQLKNLKKGTGPKESNDNEFMNGLQGKIFETLAPRMLTGGKVSLDNQKIICNNIFVEGLFKKLNDEYNSLVLEALSRFPDAKKNYIPTDVTDAEIHAPSPQQQTVSSRSQIEIDSIFTAGGDIILEYAANSKREYVCEMGDFKLEADKTYNFIVEVSVNFLTQTKTKMGQLVNYILYFRENHPTKDYVITLLTAGDFGDFQKFVKAFNDYYEDDNKFPKDKLFRDCLEKVYILKNLMKKGKNGKEGSGSRVLFIYMPFYLDKKNLDDCLQIFKNFKIEQNELKESVKKARDSQRNLLISETQAKKQLEAAHKEIDTLKTKQEEMAQEINRLMAQNKAYEDEIKRFRMKDSMEDLVKKV